MQYLLAIVFPPAAFLFAGKPFQALFSLLLMLTVLGWIPAAIWAILVVNSANADKRNAALVNALRQNATE